MRTVLLSSVAALALTFATGSLAPANAQSAAAGNAASPSGNSAPGTTNPSETPAAQPTPMSQPSAGATNAAPAEAGPTDQAMPAPAPVKHHHHVHKASAPATNPGDQSSDAGSGHWAHQPGTGESGPASMRASNIDSADTHSTIAPHLPEPKVGAGASPDVLLRAAQAAIAAHKTGTAQQALEMAETRLLDRSTAVGAADKPDENPRIAAVTDARKALANGNTKGAEAAIQTAMNGNDGGGMGQGGSMAPAPATSMGPSTDQGGGAPAAPPAMAPGSSTGNEGVAPGVTGNGAIGNSGQSNGASPGGQLPTPGDGQR